MDTLRVSLLIVGIIIVVGLYFIGRRQLDDDDRRLNLKPSIPWSKLLNKFKFSIPVPNLTKLTVPRWGRDTRHATAPHNDEVLTEEDLAGVEEIVADRKQIISNADDVTLIVELTSDQIAPGGEQLFIPITVMGRHGKLFSGEMITEAMQACGFTHDASGIFYFIVADPQGYEQKLLGLANIIEPGTFTEQALPTLETPGLVLYLHLPAPIEAREAFSLLIEKGQELANYLEADLCDETRSVLTNQTIGHLKEKVEAYRFKQKMTQLKHHRK
ncbi:MAG: cell division protein ZipA C-terminal FtsZ-binding domain-containing protein [Thioalkalispiraceae bacterium]|jgi:FtsZ-interacting cell division protein ZipA